MTLQAGYRPPFAWEATRARPFVPVDEALAICAIAAIEGSDAPYRTQRQLDTSAHPRSRLGRSTSMNGRSMLNWKSLSDSMFRVSMVPPVTHWLASLIWSACAPSAIANHLAAVLGPASSRAAATVRAARGADVALRDGLTDLFGSDYRDQVEHPAPGPSDLLAGPGVIQTMLARGRCAGQLRDISYGPHGRDNLLDIWRDRHAAGAAPAPVLIQIHGGAWTADDKRSQGHPLMELMVRHGWICVSINYRMSPQHRWPAHIDDVRRAIDWVRGHIADYGGDPTFIALTGGSAGAHLATLAALDSHQSVNVGDATQSTPIQAVVPLYGVYDLSGGVPMNSMMLPYLERCVMGQRRAEAAELFEGASPLQFVGADAPPFMIVHGGADTFIPTAQPRALCAALRGAGAPTVTYVEIPDAQRAFDIFSTVRTQLTSAAIADFLGVVYARHCRSREAHGAPLTG